MLRRLIVLALLAAGFWWYWTHWRPTHDYKQLSGRLETAINQELLRSGITDKDVLEELHHERSQWGLSWIETDRRLQADPKELPGLLDRLSREAVKTGGSVLQAGKCFIGAG